MWRKVKLGEICTLLNGRAYKKTELLDKGKYPVLRVGNFFTNRSWYHSDLELDADKYCDDGDLLYAWSASFGPQIWHGGKVIYHYHIWKTLIDQSRVNKKFLYYWFLWDVDQIKAEQGAGTTMVHVTKRSMEDRSLNLPPLPEQKCIVAILDEAFEGIDAAIANTQANLAAARELFESFLDHKLINQENDWEELGLGEVAEFRNGLNFTRTSKGEAIKIVGVKDFQREFYVPSDTLETVTINGKLRDIDCLKDGDILAVRSNGNKALIGRCLLAKGITDTTSHSGFTIRIRLASKDILPEFLTYFMKSNTCHEMLVASGGGANISNLNQQALFALAIRFPPISEQKKIISEIEEFDARIRDLTSKYQQKLDALHELKQSILAKAFRGELTQEEIAA